MKRLRIAVLLVVAAGVLALVVRNSLPSSESTAPAAEQPQSGRKAGTNAPAAPAGSMVSKARPSTNRPTATATATNRPTATAPTKGKAPTGTNVAATTQGRGTNVAATTQARGTNAPLTLVDRFRKFQESPSFYPILAIVPLCLGALFIFLSIRAKKKGPPGASTLDLPARPMGATSKRRAPVHACNVLSVAPDAKYLWQFGVRNDGVVLHREQTSLGSDPLPASAVTKNWRTLFQRKLNVAWLPPEQVFLRVVHLPASNFEETLAMVELQLEKLSPMPVGQIVWSIQLLPHPEPNQQTIIVLIVARNLVEEFLGRLEGQGYLADRLEMPVMDQLLATRFERDGVWIYPLPGVVRIAVAAWWYGGVLQNLDLITQPMANREAIVAEQLNQMAWAGEMEGWLTAPPVWHLVADASATAEWEPVLRAGLDQPVEVLPPLATPDLAGRTADRAAHAESQGNLLPPEFGVRYQQQFVDRLWMRGLGALVVLYMIGVAIYMVALQFALYRTRGVENQVVAMGPVYTNAMQLKAQYEVLKDRQELKYAALDCWKTVAELLPAEASLDGMNFADGRRLSLNGTAPADAVKQLVEFEAGMRKATANNQPLFDLRKSGSLNYRANPGGATVSWNLTMELKRTDMQ